MPVHTATENRVLAIKLPDKKTFTIIPAHVNTNKVNLSKRTSNFHHWLNCNSILISQYGMLLRLYSNVWISEIDIFIYFMKNGLKMTCNAKIPI